MLCLLLNDPMEVQYLNIFIKQALLLAATTPPVTSILMNTGALMAQINVQRHPLQQSEGKKCLRACVRA